MKKSELKQIIRECIEEVMIDEAYGGGSERGRGSSGKVNPDWWFKKQEADQKAAQGRVKVKRAKRVADMANDPKGGKK